MKSDYRKKIDWKYDRNLCDFCGNNLQWGFLNRNQRYCSTKCNWIANRHRNALLALLSTVVVSVLIVLTPSDELKIGVFFTMAWLPVLVTIAAMYGVKFNKEVIKEQEQIDPSTCGPQNHRYALNYSPNEFLKDQGGMDMREAQRNSISNHRPLEDRSSFRSQGRKDLSNFEWENKTSNSKNVKYEPTASKPIFIDEDKSVFCSICRKKILPNDEIATCPNCSTHFHFSHFVESIRQKGECPNCLEKISYIPISFPY